MAGDSKLFASTSKTFTDLRGLGDTWDAVKKVRGRVREVGVLLVDAPQKDAKECQPEGIIARSTENAKYNSDVLQPLLEKMKGSFDKVPELNALVKEIKHCIEAGGWNPSRQTLCNQAWSVRYLFGVVKNLIYKPVPPRVP